MCGLPRDPLGVAVVVMLCLVILYQLVMGELCVRPRPKIRAAAKMLGFTAPARSGAGIIQLALGASVPATSSCRPISLNRFLGLAQGKSASTCLRAEANGTNCPDRLPEWSEINSDRFPPMSDTVRETLEDFARGGGDWERDGAIKGSGYESPGPRKLSAPNDPWADENGLSRPTQNKRYLLQTAARACAGAFLEGRNLQEVEFPVASEEELQGLDGEELLKRTLRLAAAFSELVHEATGKSERVALTVVDSAEREFATKVITKAISVSSKPDIRGGLDGETCERLRQDLELAKASKGKGAGGGQEPNVRLHALQDLVAEAGQAERFFDVVGAGLRNLVGQGRAQVAKGAGIYIVVGLTCQDLPAIRDLHERDPTAKIILFNMSLDRLRGDLGLPGSPARDFQYEFLCRFTPTYFLWERTYSKVRSTRPYLLGFGGALFRVWPQRYQIINGTGDGNLTLTQRISSSHERPSFGEVKQTLAEKAEFDLRITREEPSKPAEELRPWYQREDALEKQASSNWLS